MIFTLFFKILTQKKSVLKFLLNLFLLKTEIPPTFLLLPRSGSVLGNKIWIRIRKKVNGFTRLLQASRLQVLDSPLLGGRLLHVLHVAVQDALGHLVLQTST